MWELISDYIYGSNQNQFQINVKKIKDVTHISFTIDGKYLIWKNDIIILNIGAFMITFWEKTTPSFDYLKMWKSTK